MSLLSVLRKGFTRLSHRPYRTVDATRAAALVEQGATLLDVREAAEWRAGRASGALHIPLGQLTTRLDEVPAGRTVITVCRSGHRSAMAAALLARAGHDVVNLTGGMRAWQRAGHPVAGQGGRPGRVR